MTIIYPDRRGYYDSGDPYCCRFGCPHADDCDPEECDELFAQLPKSRQQHYITSRDYVPGPASREAVARHQRKR